MTENDWILVKCCMLSFSAGNIAVVTVASLLELIF